MSTTPGAEDRLAAFTDELSRASSLAEPKVVSHELATVFEHGLQGDARTVPGAETPIEPRRNRMLTTLSTMLATVTGKVVLGTAVAAASVGTAHSAGVVDVPGLPDTTAPVESPDVEAPDADQGADEAGDQRDDGRTATTGEPDDPGVDGGEVSERATSGEPREDGREFGTSIADEATDGTPAEDKAGGQNGGRPESVPGDETADENPGTADEHAPGGTPGPDEAPDQDDAPVQDEAPGGGETADENRPGGPGDAPAPAG